MRGDKPKLCWITPDYFLNVDTHIVPELAHYYQIDWIVIVTPGSRRTADGLPSGRVTPRDVRLRYRQRDPRIMFQYAELLWQIRKERYDLIYASFHGLPFFFPVLSISLDLDKVIYGVHNVHTPEGATHERWMRLYQHFAFRMMKRFHMFSRYQLELASTLLPGKCHYYAPLSPENYGPSTVKPPRDKIRFLFFGYVRHYKRLDVLIEAFQSLYRAGVRNIELVIAGRCDDWDLYEALIDRRTGIQTRIGHVQNKDIPDLISSCHYVVFPYQDLAQSGVLLLAYFYGKPVITSDLSAFCDSVVDGSTGFRFKSLSSDSLAEVMRDIVTRHDAIYDALTRNVHEHLAKEYSPNEILAKYRNFLDHALAATRPHERIPHTLTQPRDGATPGACT
jgi:glycosyltransferase involved in cell wall biosynthesis